MARRVLILGDSISDEPYEVSGSRGWVDHLRELTSAGAPGLRGNVHIGEPWEIRSIAKPFSTLTTLTTLVTSLPPNVYDTAIVLAGRHDLDADLIDQTTLRTRASQLYAALRTNGIKTIIQCELLPFGDLRYEIDRRSFNGWLPSAGIAFCPISARFAGARCWNLSSAYDSGDGQNLSDNGSRTLAGEVLSTLLNMPSGPWYRGFDRGPTVSDFSPLEIDDCILWLRADRGVTLTAGRVSLWEDGSPRGNDIGQAVAGNRPVVSAAGGQSSILFAAATERLDGAFVGLAADEGYTGIVVIARAVDATCCVFELASAAGALANGFSMYAPAASNQIIARVANIAIDGTFSDVAATLAAADHAMHVFAHTHITTGRAVAEDGVGGQTAVTGRRHPTITQLRVGMSLDGVLYPYQGHISELIVYPRALSIDELSSLHDYVGARYGIVVP